MDIPPYIQSDIPDDPDDTYIDEYGEERLTNPPKTTHTTDMFLLSGGVSNLEGSVYPPVLYTFYVPNEIVEPPYDLDEIKEYIEVEITAKVINCFVLGKSDECC